MSAAHYSAAPYGEGDVPDQSGKTALITGANTGIGFETARVLAARGARVLLACRSQAKAQDALQRITAICPGANLDVLTLDLASLASVRKAAAAVAREPRVDVLINNAGVMVPPKTLTADGFELQFGVNHLGHFAFTGLLLPKLLKQADARIVNVASSAHKFGRMDFDDLHAERGYSAGARYGMSKLANLLFTFELKRRLADAGAGHVSVLACHPGGAETDLARHLPKMMSAAILPFARMVINSAAEGALPTLRAATDPQAVSGEYYGPAGWFEIAGSAVPVTADPRAHNAADAQRLWALSIALTGVDPLADG
jgi:NAD(P)-dependent dehydrogenase (short-subunit alcohol dehydrogenase family)